MDQKRIERAAKKLALERFMGFVMPEPNSGCWIWMGGLSSGGYGQFYVRERGKTTRKAHRFLYETLHGDVPRGLQLDHLCRVRCCVNPQHLECVTPRENYLRGVGVGSVNFNKTHCMKGHALSGVNLRLEPDGERVCRECKRERDRVGLRRRRAARKLEGKS